MQLIRKTSKDFEETRPRQRGKSASMPLRNEREISSTWSPDTPLSEGIVTFHFRWSTAFSSAVRLSEKITIKKQTHWGATLFALLNLLITGFRSEILTASESNFYHFPAIPLWPQHMSELSSFTVPPVDSALPTCCTAASSVFRCYDISHYFTVFIFHFSFFADFCFRLTHLMRHPFVGGMCAINSVEKWKRKCSSGIADRRSVCSLVVSGQLSGLVGWQPHFRFHIHMANLLGELQKKRPNDYAGRWRN